MRTYKNPLLIFLFLGLMSFSFAQNQAVHKLYLKDGNIVEGIILEQKFGESISIQTSNGERHTFAESEVELLVRLKESGSNFSVFPTNTYTAQPSRRVYRRALPISYREDRSIYNMISFGLGFGESNWGGVAVTPTIPAYRIGYRYNQYINVGAGVSLDPYSEGLLIPFYLDFHGDVGKMKKIMPHYFGQVGYGLAAAPGWQVNELNGGLYYQWGAGYKINTRGKLDWTLTAGYKSQKTWQSRQDWRFQGEVTGYRTYRRIVLQLSMGF